MGASVAMGKQSTAAARRLVIAGVLVTLAACGGGGGNGGGGATTTTVSGKITFDRVPVGNSGLNFNGVSQAPARDVVVEAIHASNSSVLASTTTNSSGDYSLTVPVSTTIFIRAKAQMLKTGSGATWDFRVLNNASCQITQTTKSCALYALDGSQFNSGTASSTRNLNAPSGWGGSSYTGTRAAAAFAILDSVYRAKELLVAAQSSLAFPALDLYWSPTNRSSDSFCPSSGLIGTTSFVTVASGDTDDCSTPERALGGIYVLGEINDTDEFDQHVIAHEFGHYVETSFSRSDSIGGSHDFGEALDMRVAFGEGWGNAFSGVVLADPAYRDSPFGGFDMDANGNGNDGWYSEAAVGHILWDLFDAGVEPGIDDVQVPFSTMFSVMTNAQRVTPALTSIFSFADALMDAAPASTQAIDALLFAESVNGNDEFGTGEGDTGGETISLPVYQDLQLNSGPIVVCTSARFGRGNKLNNRRFLRLNVPTSTTVSITAEAAAGPLGSVPASDPDVYVWRQGELVLSGIGSGGTETTQQRQLASGLFVVEVLDFAYGDIRLSRSSSTDNTLHCMRVNAAGS
jgi:hypothetical protein